MKECWMLSIESWPLSVDLPFTLQSETTIRSWSHGCFNINAKIRVSSSIFLKLRMSNASSTLLDAEAVGIPQSGGWLFSFHIQDVSSDEDEFDRSTMRVSVLKGDRIHTSFTNSPAGLSYMPVLRHYLNRASARRILEWGPGRSTLMMAESLPEAEIFCIEHNSHWYQRITMIAERFTFVHAIHEPLILQPAKSGKYVTAPLYLGHKFDVIFIDGRLRTDCIAIARQVVKDDGVVLVHDANRTWYHQAFRFFGSAKIVNNTAILRV